MKKIMPVFLIIMLGFVSCAPASTAKQTVVPTFLPANFQASPTSGSTPTPFQPIPPTATVTATATESFSTTLFSPVRLDLEKPAGQVNILILGSDYRPNQGYRTDILMVLSLNPDQGTASLTSFPRDLYVELPGIGMNRINSAQANGGFQLSKGTFLKNFDISLDYYIMTNFSGFKAIVDTLGGISVYSATGLTDKCDLPQAVNEYCSVPVGTSLMNGETALWYVRSRSTGSDLDRTRRAQEVISAIFNKTMSLNALNRGSELYNLFINSVETNLTLPTILELLPFAGNLAADPSIVKRYTIGSENVTNYVVPESGAQVLLPDTASISEIIKQAFY